MAIDPSQDPVQRRHLSDPPFPLKPGDTSALALQQQHQQMLNDYKTLHQGYAQPLHANAQLPPLTKLTDDQKQQTLDNLNRLMQHPALTEPSPASRTLNAVSQGRPRAAIQSGLKLPQPGDILKAVGDVAKDIGGAVTHQYDWL